MSKDESEGLGVGSVKFDAPLGWAIERSKRIEMEIGRDPTAFRVLTGDRPTGPLHVGHYFGTLQNRVILQDKGVAVWVLVADYQVLTDRDEADNLRNTVFEVVLDYLAIGLNPSKSVIFAHSQVPELNQLVLPFLSLVSIGELQRNPTVKDEIRAAMRRSVNGLMYTYPVHQAADILFCHANLVPGGKDQLPHLEIARTIARRFNQRFADFDYFPEPDLLLSDAPLILGLDGRKMSKSWNNSISIRADEDETAKLISGAKTDGQREIFFDPETRPEVSNLLHIAALCQDRSPLDIAQEIGSKGSAQLKRVVTESVNEYFRPIRVRRKVFEKNPVEVWNVLRSGSESARIVASNTLRDVMGFMDTVY